jgi:hypothetical protein
VLLFRRSSLIPHPSSLIPHPSSFILHPSSLIPRPSSFIPHPLPSVSSSSGYAYRHQMLLVAVLLTLLAASSAMRTRAAHRRRDRRGGRAAFGRRLGRRAAKPDGLASRRPHRDVAAGRLRARPPTHVARRLADAAAKQAGWRWGGSLRLWHVATREELFSVRRLDSGGHLHIDFSPDGRRLAAATGDRDAHGHVFVWSPDPAAP